MGRLEVSSSYYEAHVTMLGQPDGIAPIVRSLGWKFSAIDGDPTLGPGLKCYATRHFKESVGRSEILTELMELADILKTYCTVVRRKIELVVYDDRSSTVRFACDGACPECNT